MRALKGLQFGFHVLFKMVRFQARRRWCGLTETDRKGIFSLPRLLLGQTWNIYYDHRQAPTVMDDFPLRGWTSEWLARITSRSRHLERVTTQCALNWYSKNWKWTMQACGDVQNLPCQQSQTRKKLKWLFMCGVSTRTPKRLLVRTISMVK